MMCILTACFWSKDSEPSTATTKGISLSNIFEPYAFDHPVGLEHRVGKPEVLYIVEQGGRIISVNIDNPKENRLLHF